jgi:hypothetical protein
MKVEVDGLAAFINRLEKFNKDVSKELKAEMTKAASLVVSDAKSAAPGAPLSGWGRWIDAGVMPKSTGGRDLSYKSGYKTVTNRYRARGATVGFGKDVSTSNPGAGIFQFAGTQNRTPNFTQQIVLRFGAVKKVPRVLGPAYYRNMPEVRARIESAIRSAQRKVGQ